ncbi:uncharacterized protein LOC121734969 isoform X2 [Aricia agestis]|uniref:uncharacterized protein LOC121734969 isoform X2 n=1 Tax=Aricia agestis TaxID=91739 RepID=UPI001C205DFB|nr:uncharacterized protein LOC121734969 isoform X2 [Aricia agestis]
MPENPRNNQQKNKNESKEQRRKRQQNRHPPGPVDKKGETEVTKPTVAEKPVPSEPPPDFYKNLKRETDEILKITEEANSKYKKKEIQSNWAKYEMPIESYDEIDEQESIGADFESLIQASLSVGGHFQFKHEKSWDVTTGPSVYDKYFDINMDNLNLGLSTITFYDRNNIDTSLFTESDILTMNHRATKFKNKYYNDNKYTTAELEAENKILSMMKSDNECIETKSKIDETDIDISAINLESNDDKAISQEDKENVINVPESPKNLETKETEEILFESPLQDNKKVIDNTTVQSHEREDKLAADNVPEKAAKNPVIESPEDLEKWLDDFLDG